MTDTKSFIERWKNHGYERGESQQFWLDLLGNVFGIKNLHNYIFFEEQINGRYIDALIPTVKVLIEQKSIDKNLADAYKQAKDYDDELPFYKKSRWIVTCDFQRFEVHDMNKPKQPPEIILLENLEREYHRLQFLIDENYIRIQRELEISIQAGDIVGKLYDALLTQYLNPKSDESLKSLNKLCVRLVFCLYAESAGVFGKHKIFRDYLEGEQNIRRALIDLFEILDTPLEERDPYLDDTLKKFPYVNGGLFKDEDIEIPNFNDAVRNLLLEEASSNFDWSNISPTIFGAVFESTLNPVTRRSGGMHYTNVENIHKVIDQLFLDDLREEFETCNTKRKLQAFQDKLATLKFFDPACGSGNFLTETYLSLRRLENKVLTKLQDFEGKLFGDPVKVSISQFYGIEINDFAVSVAKTALWISELQMKETTVEIIQHDIEMLPLKTNANIIEGNALQLDWNSVASNVNFIISNPPFSGARVMTPAQKSDVGRIFDGWRNIGNLDYVSCWFKQVADFIIRTKIRAALVSTNSICQGDAVATLWKPLFNSGVHIDFAYRTFKWYNESLVEMAKVHCVIVSFSRAFNPKPKIIFDGDKKIFATNINAYLQDAPNVFVESRSKPLCDVPEIGIGNKPIDDGNYLFTLDEMNAFIKKEPSSKKYFKLWYGGYEFLHNKPRYCLWLGDCTPHELHMMPKCLKRVEAVRDYRLQSKSAGTRKIADKPTRFHVENMPKGNFIVIPEISSERRKYIPIGFMSDSVLCSNRLKLIPNATIYHFGVLTSSVHMAWTKIVCGRLETRYCYSNDIVYNNFVWCEPTEKQRKKIESTAQEILDARAKFPDSSLAELYNESTMPVELRRAHQANDKAVMAAYGFRADMTEAEVVAELMTLYQALTQ